MAVLLRREWLWLLCSLVLVAVVVGYLGTRGMGQEGEKELTELAEEKDGPEEEMEEFPPGEISPWGKSGTDFFVEYRLERERVRAQQMEVLREIIHNPNSEAESRREAQNVLLEISQNMEREMELEGLIKAGGFEDAVVFLKPDQVQVIIKGEELEKSQVVQVGDLVRRMTALPLEAIVIDNHI